MMKRQVYYGDVFKEKKMFFIDRKLTIMLLIDLNTSILSK